MKKYLLGSLAYSILHLAAYWIASLADWEWHPYFPLLILFFFLQSVILSWILSLARFDKQRFPIYALASVSIRFVTGVLLLIVFLVFEVPDLQSLTLLFVAVYLSFMIFELTILLANLRRNSGRNS